MKKQESSLKKRVIAPEGSKLGEGATKARQQHLRKSVRDKN